MSGVQLEKQANRRIATSEHKLGKKEKAIRKGLAGDRAGLLGKVQCLKHPEKTF